MDICEIYEKMSNRELAVRVHSKEEANEMRNWLKEMNPGKDIPFVGGQHFPSFTDVGMNWTWCMYGGGGFSGRVIAYAEFDEARTSTIEVADLCGLV